MARVNPAGSFTGDKPETLNSGLRCAAAERLISLRVPPQFGPAFCFFSFSKQKKSFISDISEERIHQSDDFQMELQQ